jgi:hypothetical protein
MPVHRRKKDTTPRAPDSTFSQCFHQELFLLASHMIHPGVVIMSQGKKCQRDRAQIILVLQTSSKVFLANPGCFTHSSARSIQSFLSDFFIHSKEYVFTLSVKGDLSLYYASLSELYKGFVQKVCITDVHKW